MIEKGERLEKLCTSSDVKRQLRQASESQYGLATDAVRRLAWPLLLNNSEDTAPVKWDDLSVKYKDERQVHVDVLRSLNCYDICDNYSDSEK